MNIQITARHFKARPDLQQFVEDSVNGLSQLFDGIVSADIVLEHLTQSNADTKMAEISLLVYREKLFAKETTDDFLKSVSACIEKLERQLIRYKEKLHEGQQPHDRVTVGEGEE